AGRLSHFFDIGGPVVTVDTSCSSSLVALHFAVESLRRGECDLAGVAGVQLVFSAAGLERLRELGVLSPTGRCRPFSAGADGFARGEGCVALILRRVGDALAAGDPIRAVVRGTAITHDGRSATMAAPNPAAQERAI